MKFVVKIIAVKKKGEWFELDTDYIESKIKEFLEDLQKKTPEYNIRGIIQKSYRWGIDEDGMKHEII